MAVPNVLAAVVVVAPVPGVLADFVVEWAVAVKY